MSVGRRESGLQPGRLRFLSAAIGARGQMVIEAIATWVERRRTRRRLNHLSDHMLKDIGISRADRARELEKPFWRK